MSWFDEDQWEEEAVASGRGGGGFAGGAAQEELLSHMVEETVAPSSRERPMFVLEKVQFKPNSLKRMAVSSGVVIMAQSNNHLIRLNLAQPSDIDDIPVNRKDNERIENVFVDPTGKHVVLSYKSGDNMYLHADMPKPKPLKEIRGFVITSIAWDSSNTSTTSTGPILIGTAEGQFYETVFDCTEKTYSQYWKGPLYSIDSSHPVMGLIVERFPPTASESNKFYVLATTPTRIYEFIGGPTFEHVFANYDSNAAFMELPGSIGHSELHVFRQFQGLPSFYAWMADPGIYHGALRFGSQNPGDSVMVDSTLLQYPGDSRRTGRPVSLALTEFHFLLVYKDRFQAICRLNDKVVFEQALPARVGEVQGLAADPMLKRIWVYCESALFEISILDESRNVWALYLDQGQYQLALEYCKDDPQKMDQVYCAQADHYYEQNNLELAATYYGKTQKQFEEVTLKFINRDERDALKTFLVNKLANLDSTQATQKTLICTWLTEIYLNKLNEIPENEKHKEDLRYMEDEFLTFLEDNKRFLDYTTTINLITSHGRVKEMVNFANIMEDYERVINYFINVGDYAKALKVMNKPVSEELFYRFSPVLMHHSPFFTVNAWIRGSSFLSPRKLIPALMRYDPANNPEDETENQAVRYLEHCVFKLGNRDETIHNFLLSLYAQNNMETKLLDFLRTPDPYFDLKYALRLCTQYGEKKAMVLIYGAMGLYEEAVELSLDVDIELAKANADKPDDDDELRKKLWLRVARHVVEKKQDIKKAMEFLKDCDLLKIEDILPFFPDFTRIDLFKDEICASLEAYNKDIEDLRLQMDDATRSAEEIRSDIKKLRNKYGFVAGNQTCQLCDAPVLTRQFYLFPCQHVFHSDCLQEKMLKHLSEMERQKLGALKSKLRNLQYAPQRNGPNDAAANASRMKEIDRLRTQMDELVASECIYCGDMMIDQIAAPFVSEKEIQEEAAWNI